MNKKHFRITNLHHKTIIWFYDLRVDVYPNSNYMSVDWGENSAAIKNWKSVRKFIKLTNEYNEAIENLAHE